jgi:hypothetical protein
MEMQSKSLSIVLVGSFNPPIFHPLWLETKGLISSKDRENSNVNIGKLNNEFVGIVKLDWAHIQVQHGQFVITGTDERRYEAIRDLVVGIFEILGETPLFKLGINLESDYLTNSEKQWDELGYALVPPKFWGQYLNKPGMAQVQVREKERQDGFPGYFNVMVAPTIYNQEEKKYGLKIATNDHYEVKDEGQIDNAEPVIIILKKQWESSIKRSEAVTKEILKLV